MDHNGPVPTANGDSIHHPTTPHRDEHWTVLYTRGPSCAQIAELVSSGTAHKVDGDIKTACIARRANVLVTSRAGSFDLASTLVPHGIDEEHLPPTVIGAVGAGPHSPLVAATTMRLAAGLGAEAILVTMSADPTDDPAALEVLAGMQEHAPGAEAMLVRADHPSSLLDQLPPAGLVVLGAPGGSWWQRQFFGAGRKLIHAAAAGSIVVRAAERRCFHSMSEMTAIGPLMRAADAAAIAMIPVVPVVDDGIVIGQARVEALRAVEPATPVGEVAEPAITALADDPITVIPGLASSLEGAPVPVVDDDGRLLGGVSARGVG